jgi:hypothetical protein
MNYLEEPAAHKRLGLVPAASGDTMFQHLEVGTASSYWLASGAGTNVEFNAEDCQLIRRRHLAIH